MSAEHKAETHQRIVVQASRTFRSEGASASILPLMKSVGLTHGGFYRHFATKEDLFLESLEFGFDEAAQQFEAAAASAEPGQEIAAIINSYLQLAHVKHPEFGCAIPTLGTDISRQNQQTRKAAQNTIKKFIERMANFMPGRTSFDRQNNFYILFSSLVGAVTMARMISDANSRERILEANRQFLIRSFIDGKQLGDGEGPTT
jgi:TetR/AcrR family transcriptional repressor of nem operon